MSREDEIGTAAREWPPAAILIPNWNGCELLARCLPLLARLDYSDYRIIVVDNGSTDGSVAYISEHFPEVSVITLGENVGFAPAVNAGLDTLEDEIAILLNNDVFVSDPGWLTALVEPLVVDEEAGITGSKLRYPDGTIQHAGAHLSYPLAYSHHLGHGEKDGGAWDEQRDVPYVTGAAMAIAPRVRQEIGLLDEAFSPFYYEEVDFCYRARAAGYRVLYVPASSAVHEASTSMKKVSERHALTFHRNRLRFVLKHYSAAQFLDDFVPAEEERLNEVTNPAELAQSRQAYLEIALEAASRLDDTQAPALLAALATLYRAARDRELAIAPGPEDRRPALLQEAGKHHALETPTFTSDKAVVGPLIASFRESWNNVSTRWYLEPILTQQQIFNALIVQLLEHQSQLLDERSRRESMNADEIKLLLANLATARTLSEAAAVTAKERVESLERQVARLSERVAQLEKGDQKEDGRTEK